MQGGAVIACLLEPWLDPGLQRLRATCRRIAAQIDGARLKLYAHVHLDPTVPLGTLPAVKPEIQRYLWHALRTVTRLHGDAACRMWLNSWVRSWMRSGCSWLPEPGYAPPVYDMVHTPVAIVIVVEEDEVFPETPTIREKYAVSR